MKLAVIYSSWLNVIIAIFSVEGKILFYTELIYHVISLIKVKMKPDVCPRSWRTFLKKKAAK